VPGRPRAVARPGLGGPRPPHPPRGPVVRGALARGAPGAPVGAGAHRDRAGGAHRPRARPGVPHRRPHRRGPPGPGRPARAGTPARPDGAGGDRAAPPAVVVSDEHPPPGSQAHRDAPTLELPAVRSGLPEAELRALVRALGVPHREIEQAAVEGTLVMLAIDRLALPQELRYDVAGAAEATGLQPEEVRHIWRSLGFPEPADGEVVFSEVDVRNMRAVADLMA